MSGVWVLTREINEYNQEGEYFIAAYQDKPDLDKLKETITDVSDDYLEHILTTGGRLKYEEEWYRLCLVELL